MTAHTEVARAEAAFGQERVRAGGKLGRRALLFILLEE